MGVKHCSMLGEEEWMKNEETVKLLSVERRERDVVRDKWAVDDNIKTILSNYSCECHLPQRAVFGCQNKHFPRHLYHDIYLSLLHFASSLREVLKPINCSVLVERH